MSMLKRRVQQHAAAKLSTQQLPHAAPAGARTPGSSSTVQHMLAPSCATAAAVPDRNGKELQVRRSAKL
jgi:hypothetical protein